LLLEHPIELGMVAQPHDAAHVESMSLGELDAGALERARPPDTREQ
jgi:hypothetical protein